MNNLGGLTCRRQRWDDTICERRRCKEYSVELSGETCSFSCGKLIWKSDYELKIIYSNFGDIPEPVEDGVCPEESYTTTIVTPSVSSTTVREISTVFEMPNEKNDTTTITPSSPTTEVESSRSSFEKYNDSVGDPDFENKIRPNRKDNDKEKKDTLNETRSSEDNGSIIVPMPVLVGAVTNGVIILVVAIVVSCRLSKDKKSERNKIVCDIAAAQNSQTIFTESDRAGIMRAQTLNENLERVVYHTLDEVADNVEHQPPFDKCDEQGYTVISDCDTKDFLSNDSRDRKCRPLPQPPNVRTANKIICSEPPTDSSAGQCPSLWASNSSAGTDVSSVKPPPYMSTLEDPASPKDSVSSLPPPRPHVRLVNLENLKYMGLVKLRQDQARFGQETEVKLIRTQEGNLELVNVHEELPTLKEYYTNLQLIKQRNGSIGVVGLLEAVTESAGNDGSADQPLPIKRSEYVTFDPETPLPRENAVDEDANSPCDEEKRSNPCTVYFGSVELNAGVKVNPCDYLSVRDINPSDMSARSDGYLTVKDLENIDPPATSESVGIKQ